MTSVSEDDSPPVVEIAGLSKTFPGQRALSDFAINLQPGEIHALVGENGCGKSTLIKCLAGYHSPDSGSSIVVRGQALPAGHTSTIATHHGLVFVHQEFGIVPSLSVMENVALGSEFVTKGGRIQWRDQATQARAALAILGREDIAPSAIAGRLPASAQAIIAIARALSSAGDGANLIVLDEPTAALPQVEVEALFTAIRSLAAAGTAVLFVSHRLQEVFEIADRVTVLRDSKIVGTYETADIDERTLVNKIVGRDLSILDVDAIETVREDIALKVDGLSGNRVREVSFNAHRGEIVGIAGLQGSGRSELLRLLFGAQRCTAGQVDLGGHVVTFRSPAAAISAGVALVPEDRIRQGTFRQMSVGDNISLSTLRRYWSQGRLQTGLERRRVDELIKKFDIRPGNSAQVMARLSGGNQQKAVLAKWIETDPCLLLLDEPAQGVDVGSKSDIYHLIEQWVIDTQSTVLMVNSDFDDLNALCHRVLVMREGRLVAELAGPTKTVDRMIQLAYLRETA